MAEHGTTATIPRRKWSSIVAEVCDEFGLLPQHVSRRKANQVVRIHGTAICRCSRSSCNNTWTSYRGWIMVDCRQRRVPRVWKQKCYQCNTECTFFACKEFPLRQAIRLAVLKCVEQVDGIAAYNGNGEGHDESDIHKCPLCEKCGYGRVNCATGAPLELAVAPLESAVILATAVPPEPAHPLPTEFVGWTSWRDVGRFLLVTREQQEARAKSFHAVKVALEGNTALAVQQVYESGSVATGTQLPVSDIDIVLFIEDFRPGRAFFTRRLNAVLQCLQAQLRANVGATAVYERDDSANHNRYSRKFRILEPASGLSFKFDVLLGGQLRRPRAFLQLRPEMRRAWSASSSKWQREFVRKWTQPAAHAHISESQITCRNAILAFKHWKRLVGAPGLYFPSYLIELIAIQCILRGTEDERTRVGPLFSAMIACVAGQGRMMIEFTAQNECLYGRADLDRGLPHRQSPSVADPGNPTNDMACPHYPINWRDFWGPRAGETRDNMIVNDAPVELAREADSMML